MALQREFFAPFVDASPGMAVMEDCESLTHLRNKKTIAEEYPARHFLGIQQNLENGKVGNVYWLPCPENLADRPAKVKSNTAPLLRLLQSGLSRPGALRLSRWVAIRENGGACWGGQHLFIYLVVVRYVGYCEALFAWLQLNSFCCGGQSAGFFILTKTS